MKNYSTFLIATVAAGFLSGPLLAQDAPMMDLNVMTCADLMKMDQPGMMAAATTAEMMMQMSAMTDAQKAIIDDKHAVETQDLTAPKKLQFIAMALLAENKAKTDAMSDADKAAARKMTESHLAKMEAACKGNDAMMMGDVMKAMK